MEKGFIVGCLSIPCFVGISLRKAWSRHLTVITFGIIQAALLANIALGNVDDAFLWIVTILLSGVLSTCIYKLLTSPQVKAFLE